MNDIINEDIELLFEKEAYLIDIFPQTVPARADDRYFDVERYFRNNNAVIRQKHINIILKLSCYYDITVITQDGTFVGPHTDMLLTALEKCFRRETAFVHILLTGKNILITIDNDDLYITVYNADLPTRELISKLVCAEGLFFYKAPVIA